GLRATLASSRSGRLPWACPRGARCGSCRTAARAGHCDPPLPRPRSSASSRLRPLGEELVRRGHVPRPGEVRATVGAGRGVEVALLALVGVLLGAAWSAVGVVAAERLV